MDFSVSFIRLLLGVRTVVIFRFCARGCREDLRVDICSGFCVLVFEGSYGVGGL